MLTNLLKYSRFVSSVSVIVFLASCKKDEPSPANLRATFDYTVLSSNTAYDSLFADANGESTVELTDANNRLNMFKAINDYLRTSSGTGTAQLDVAVLKNMFSNTANPFTGNYAILNSTSVQIRNATAASRTDAEAVRTKIEDYFTNVAIASKSVANVASSGKAGKLGSYLVDEKGIEWGQVIQKSFIGGYQYDYIGNVLFSDDKLNADNKTLVSGKNYTQLEHNWDEAYGTLTLNKVYAGAATATSNGGESFIGAYLWEYNKDGYVKIHPAFLRGRAAIVNNDKTEAKAQAAIIKLEMEKAIASAAVGYLGKWKTGTTDASRAHAIGEGLGFIYSLRFCKVHGADNAFSDDLLNNLVYSSTNGFWDLTNEKVNPAIDAIKLKFSLN